MRLKRIVAAMLSLTMVCGAGTVVTDHPAFNVSSAYTAEEDPISEFTEGLFMCEEYSDHIRVKCIICQEEDIVIPEEIHGLPVTEVGTFMGSGFMTSGDVTIVTSVVIPDTVVAIGDHAFGYWTSLGLVTMSKNVRYIGQGAFSGTAISEIDLPEGLETIELDAFSSCKNLTSVEIPDTVKEIGESAFSYCTSMENAVINGTSVVPYMFSHCTNLETATIGDNVTSIGEYAFHYCEKLKNLTIGNSVEKIEDWAISGCSELEELVLPESLKELHGFNSCEKLLNITMYSRDCEIIYIGGSTMMTLTDKSGNWLPEPMHAVTLYGYCNSTAHEFAKNKNYLFVPLDPENETHETTDVSAETGTGTVTTVNPDVHYVPVGTGVASPEVVPRTATRNTTPAPETVATAVQNTASTAVQVATADPHNSPTVAVKTTATTQKPVTTSTSAKPTTTTTTASTSTTTKPTTTTTTVSTSTTPKPITATTTATAKPVTNAPITSSAEPATSTEPVTTKPAEDTAEIGDVNGDDVVDSSDASDVLLIYAEISTGGNDVTEAQKAAADLNGDGLVDSADASMILEYYAYVSTGGTDTVAEYFGIEKETSDSGKANVSVMYTPSAEIKNAPLNSGYVQICGDIFRNGGYLTVKEFIEKYKDNWECPRFDPSAPRSNDLFFLDFKNKKNNDMVIELVCVELPSGAETDGDLVVCKIRPWEGVNNVTWYPGGISYREGTETIELAESLVKDAQLTEVDESNFKESIPKNDVRKNVGTYCQRHYDEGNSDSITAVVELKDENLFGVKPFFIFGFYVADADRYYANKSYLVQPENGPARVSQGGYDWFSCDGKNRYSY